MKPAQLVSAHMALQKLHSDCNDLVLIERSGCIENIMGHLDTPERKEVLEFARALATQVKTGEIKGLKECLLRDEVELSGDYIENQLSQCRKLHDSVGVPAERCYGAPIWTGSGYVVNQGLGGSATVIDIAEAKKH